MKALSVILNNIQFGESYVCVSTGVGFHKGGEYDTRVDNKNIVHLVNDFNHHVYPGMSITGTLPCFLKAPQTLNKISLKSERLSKEEIDMTPSKVKEVINRLNGIKPGEEKLIDLRQVSSTKTTFELDLAHMLANSPAIKDLKPGSDSIITGLDVDLHNGKVAVHLSKGLVAKESNSTVAAALTELVANHEVTVE